MARQSYSPAQIAAHLGHADGGVLALRTYVHADPLADSSFIDAALADAGANSEPELAEEMPTRNAVSPRS